MLLKVVMAGKEFWDKIVCLSFGSVRYWRFHCIKRKPALKTLMEIDVKVDARLETLCKATRSNH